MPGIRWRRTRKMTEAERKPPQKTARAYLHLENIYKSYGKKVVLDDIDLQVSEGEFITLVGPSGCGKSTLLRLILGQERPTAGAISIDGLSVGLPNPDRGIVYQKYPLFPHLTVLENIMLGPRLSQNMLSLLKRKRAIRDEAMAHLDMVKLAEHGDKFPHQLSGGMQQRVAIAQALIMKPKILLMDEPFGALDPGTREHLQVFLLELWEKRHMTVFLVTHDLEEAIYLGTRILVLSQFYCDGRGKNSERGSKIVFDEALERRATSTKAKGSEHARNLVQRIRREGFDPMYLQHITEFNLRHRDSFQTLTEEEKKR